MNIEITCFVKLIRTGTNNPDLFMCLHVEIIPVVHMSVHYVQFRIQSNNFGKMKNWESVLYVCAFSNKKA